MVDKTVGVSAVSMSQSITPPPKGRSPDHRPDCGKLCSDIRDQRSRVVLSMKHEVRVMQGQAAAASSTSPRPTDTGARPFASIYAGAKHAVEGITSRWALELAKSGIRVNAVRARAHGHWHADRFTGTAENKAALVRQVPLDRLGLSESRRRLRIHRVGRS